MKQVSTSLIACAVLAACATQVPIAIPDPAVSPAASATSAAAAPAATDGTGNLLVYSATYASTAEQSEYPVHTNYTIATTDDKVIRNVTNRAGPFYADPAEVTLPVGEYHVRAQFDRGGFVIVPVSVAPGKTTIVDLSHEPLPAAAAATHQAVRLPDGRVVGWLATSG